MLTAEPIARGSSRREVENVSYCTISQKGDRPNCNNYPERALLLKSSIRRRNCWGPSVCVSVSQINCGSDCLPSFIMERKWE
jgi:hypothetical protein